MNVYDDSDRDMHRDDAEAVQADQRRVYAGRDRHDCPTCGKPDQITDEMKRRGYHCDECTALAEG